VSRSLTHCERSTVRKPHVRLAKVPAGQRFCQHGWQLVEQSAEFLNPQRTGRAARLGGGQCGAGRTPAVQPHAESAAPLVITRADSELGEFALPTAVLRQDRVSGKRTLKAVRDLINIPFGMIAAAIEGRYGELVRKYRSGPRPAGVPSTTNSAPGESSTMTPCGDSLTGSSASCTDVSRPAPSTTSQRPGVIAKTSLNLRQRLDIQAPGMSLRMFRPGLMVACTSFSSGS
jgi:hypothetical protein